jgi:alkylation response protein AidB-like acyl-CoA dehydrogenase
MADVGDTRSPTGSSASAALRQLRAEIRVWFGNTMSELRRARPALGATDPDQQFAERRHYAKLLARDGWATMSWDRRYGGRGSTFTEQLVFIEESVRAGAPDPLSRLGTDIIGPGIAQFGSDAQRNRFLRPIRDATEFWCQGFSEPDAGSDLASLRTAAIERDGGWIINGQKIWTTIGQHADWCLLLARTDRTAERHHGISAFAVNMRAEGVTVRPISQITGDSDFSEVFLDDVWVPGDQLFGTLGDGWPIAMIVLGYERSINFVTRQVRLAKQVDDLIAQVRRRAGDVPTRLKNRLVDIYVNSVALRATVEHHIEALDRGEPPGPQNSASKVFWSESFQELADLGAELEASVSGFGSRADWSHLYVLSRAATIYAGTSEIQRNIVAERGLGLPR